MDFVKDVVENVWVQRFFWSAIVILVSVIIYGIVSRIINRREQRKSKLLTNKKNIKNYTTAL